ncbi:MAG: PspC domain-containing protein [Prevotella sp.]|nr:PspC domain-containing protein [Prevotella sp.]MDD4533626.1 PspC domain-containing protein [Prevotella sp.]
MANGKKLVRSRDRILAGILGGFAEYMDFDPTVVRVIYALLTVCTAFSGVIIYLILWLIIPEDYK